LSSAAESRASARSRPPPCSANSARSPASLDGRSSRMSAFIRSSTRAATARRLPSCRAWALALRAVSLYLAGGNAVRGSGEWRTIDLRKKAQGKTAKQALVVVAVKLLHALYAMLKHRQPYNPSHLLVAPATIGS
jgi:hypothetical protein